MNTSQLALLRIAPFVCVLITSCQPQAVIPPANAPTDDSIPLAKLVSRTLQENLQERGLSTSTHGAWQVIHGVLAYGDSFKVETDGGEVPAIEYLASGGQLAGFQPRKGNIFGDRPGLKVLIQPNEKIGQGHRDQWLAVLAQSGLDENAIIKSGGHEFTMRDWMNQAEWDSPPSVWEQEYSWTLIALTAYNDTEHRWLASNGNTYNVESLVKSELNHSLETSACGGTHRLIGVAMALAKRKQEGAPMTETWQQAQEVIDNAIQLSRQNQNPDGSYSGSYMHRTGWTRDLGESLGTTGHVLEFLAIAGSDQLIQEDWVARSVRRLCKVLDQCKGIDLECGALYHALHGLAEYEARLAQL